MKPASFRHLQPASVDEALAMLAEHGADARILAGGQSLVPMMNFRLARPAVLIDINRIPDLAFIEDAGSSLRIGAMTRERAVETSALVKSSAPLIHAATENIAHLPIRSRGTVGGSIANADPAAEYPAAVLALDATLVAKSVRGERRIAAADFFQGVLTTALEADEMLTEIVVPKAPAGSGAAFVELSRRHGDLAMAGVGCEIVLSGDTVTGIRLGVCGVGAGPVRLRAAEAALLGKTLGQASIVAAARAASAEVDPESDVHASADYRRRLAGVMTKRAVEAAAAKIGQPA